MAILSRVIQIFISKIYGCDFSYLNRSAEASAEVGFFGCRLKSRITFLANMIVITLENDSLHSKRSPLSRAPSEIANDSRKIMGGWLYPVFYLNSCRIIKLLSLIRYPFFFSPKEYTFPDLSKNLFCQMEKRKRTI